MLYSAAQSSPLGVALALLVCSLAGSAIVSGFTAEDAYIVARYARNFVATGEVQFNPGERINALTSPLHFGISVILAARAPGDPVYWGKAFGAGSLALSALTLALVELRDLRASSRWLFLVLVLVSPFSMLWAVGGLETPYLTSLTMLGVVAVRRWLRGHSGFPVAMVVGASFLCRFDSLAFWLPAAATLARKAPISRWIWPASLVGVLCGSWLLLTWSYFGDIFPTSFYVKTPGTERAFENAIYVGQYLVLHGAGPVACLAGLCWRGDSRKQYDQGAWIWSGLAAVGLYGLTTATTHMMFSYRLLVPWGPLLALVAVEVVDLKQSDRFAIVASGAMATISAALVAWLCLINMNPGFVGEYRQTSVPDYATFTQALARSGEDLVTDAARRGISSPRLQTGMGGVTPWIAEDVHVFEPLVSYRHSCRPDTQRSTDYVQDMSTTSAAALPNFGSRSAALISSQPARLEGQGIIIRLWYLPGRLSNLLPPRVYGACRTTESSQLGRVQNGADPP